MQGLEAWWETQEMGGVAQGPWSWPWGSGPTVHASTWKSRCGGAKGLELGGLVCIKGVKMVEAQHDGHGRGRGWRQKRVAV